MMQNNSHESADPRGLAFSALTILAWSFTGVFVRASGPVHPALLTGLRLWIALACTVAVLPFLKRRLSSFRTTTRNLRAWMQAGLLVLYYFGAVSAFRFAPVAEVSLMIASAPVLVLIAQWIVHRTVRPREAVGVATAFAGVAIVLLTRPVSHHLDWPHEEWGAALALAAAAFSAGYASMGRAAQRRGSSPPALEMSILTYLLGGSVLLPVLAWLPSHPLQNARWPAIWALAILSTLVPSISAAVAARRLRPSVNTSFSLLLPVLSALAAWAVLGERIHGGFWPGTAMTLAGLAVVLRSQQKRA